MLPAVSGSHAHTHTYAQGVLKCFWFRYLSSKKKKKEKEVVQPRAPAAGINPHNWKPSVSSVLFLTRTLVITDCDCLFSRDGLPVFIPHG